MYNDNWRWVHLTFWMVVMFNMLSDTEGKGREGKGPMFHSYGVGRRGNEGHKGTTDAYQIMNAMPTTPNSPSTSGMTFQPLFRPPTSLVSFN
jgi:hypothetical protein